MFGTFWRDTLVKLDIYFWRQSLILFSGFLSNLSTGVMHGFPAVLSPDIMSPNGTNITTTVDHASSIAAINGIGGVVGVFILSSVMQFFGRKATNYCNNIFLLTGWIIFPFAQNIAALYAARLIQGFANGGVYINIITLAEYVHPRRRGYFVTLKKVSIVIGILICHSVSLFWTWRQIAILASIFPLAAIVLTFYWPESPSFLALKGRFTECEKSFIWLNGNSEESQQHLKSLLEAQKEKFEKRNTTNFNVTCDSLQLWKIFRKKDFRKSISISLALTLALDLCGKYYFSAYVIEIMMKLTGNKTSAMYFTAGVNIFTLIALLLSTLIIRLINRRLLLFTSGAFAVFLMLLISVLVYIKAVYTFSPFYNWVIAIIIIIQCFIVNIGLIPASFAIVSEIFALEDKGFGSFLVTIAFTSLYAIILKITPVLLECVGLYGTFSIYGVGLAVCLVFLYTILPETKDMTLQEIEDKINCVNNKEIISL